MCADQMCMGVSLIVCGVVLAAVLLAVAFWPLESEAEPVVKSEPRIDSVAQERSDFVGYCSRCGMPVYTHHALMLDDPGCVLSHMDCVKQ